MRKLSLNQLFKTGAAYTIVGTVTVEAWLLLADRTGVIDTPGDWYINAPLVTVGIVGIPATIALGERLIHIINPKPGKIQGFTEAGPSPLFRPIPLNSAKGPATVLANSVKSIFGESIPAEDERPQGPAAWTVPVGEEAVIVREDELADFLKVADKRPKHKFSRRYWCKTRKPPLYRPKYEAFMTLLTAAGLVAGRHADGRASGYLITKPHHALTFLKHESAFKAA